MRSKRYEISRNLGSNVTPMLVAEPNDSSSATTYLGNDQYLDIAFVENALPTIETRIDQMLELSQSQLTELRRCRLILAKFPSVKADELFRKIAQLRDRYYAQRRVMYINKLEEQYQKLAEEYESASFDRQSKILKEQDEIYDKLNLLGR